MTERRIEVVFLPSLVQAEDLRGHSVIVIDVLRASSTIVAALHNGATQVIPCETIERAIAIARQYSPPGILGGERNGLKIEGFDLGNCPLEYAPSAVRERTVVLATTNGTPAMSVCKHAKDVWIGSFVNVSAVVERLLDEPLVTLLCAGTNRWVTGEDALFAGCVIERLWGSGVDARLNDQATVALFAWREVARAIERGASLADLLAEMHGGRNLVRAGLRPDIDYCATFDRFRSVPRLDIEAWSIRVP